MLLQVYIGYESVLRNGAAQVKIQGAKSVFHITDINIYPANGRVIGIVEFNEATDKIN